MTEALEVISLEQNGEKYWQINQDIYQLVLNYRDGFQPDIFSQRYSEILKKYDFIVGDWSHEQLRLRGFYYDDLRGVPKDMKISSLEDYLVEYCSFGCSYFVLERLSDMPSVNAKRSAHIKEKKKKVTKNKWVLASKKDRSKGEN